MNTNLVYYQMSLPQLPDDVSPVANTCTALGLNVKKLAFFRWLVAHGKITEGV